MSIYAWAGQRSAALQQYRSCVQALDEELGVAPLEATTELYEALRAKRLPSLPTLADSHPSPSAPTVVSRPTPAPAPPERSPIPFVGRDMELACLLEAWHRDDDGGRVMIVAGEAGIGKTRLAQEFLRQVRGESAGALVARCFEGESHLAYGPLAMALRSTLQHNGAGWPARLETTWAAEISRLFPELASARGETEYLPPIEGAGAQTRFYEALRRALIAACASTTTTTRGVFVLDDAQWADGATLTFLAYLARRLADQPLSVMLLYRTDEAGEQPELEHLLGVARKTTRA